MNNRIMNMVIRQVILVLTTKGISAFFNARKNRADSRSVDSRFDQVDGENDKNATPEFDKRRMRQQMKNIRRIGRF